jgi:transposase
MDGAISWIGSLPKKSNRVHACLESTGRYSLGIACALYEAGHVFSIINPAQLRDFVRTKLGRNKTDGVDALCFGVLKTGKPFDAAIAMGC